MKNIFYLMILIFGFLFGFFLSKITFDEIKNWKKRLIALSIISITISVIISLTNFDYKLPVILSLFFMAITSLTILYKAN